MKKLATAVAAAIALIGTPAFAQAPPPAPVYNWTGFYVGGNVGYGWGNANTDFTANGNITTFGVPCPFDECPTKTVDVPASFASAVSNTAHPNGVIGGGQIGYNYQFSPNGVFGIEADIQGADQRASGQIADPFVFSTCFLGSPLGCSSPGSGVVLNPGTVLTSYQAKIDWFGTVRGRLGVLVGDQLLIYGTGGLAYGEVAVSGSANISAFFKGLPPPQSSTPAPFTPTTAGFDASKTNVGFSVGGGMEGRLSYWLPPNWTWKLEYLYLDLGSIDTTTPFVLLSPHPASITNITGNITTHTHFTDNIIRAGLNYQFH
jgi:outer membrane immunogenic protein